MNSVDRLANLQQVQKAEVNSGQTLSKLWAKKYVQKLTEPEEAWEASSKNMRSITAQRLLQSLRSTSVQAWTKTEALLAKEVKRHGINYRLIDPWEIAKDSHFLYEKALLAYSELVIPRRLCVWVASDVSRIRQKYTEIDPRVIGFVSMQIHYGGQLLLETLPEQEQTTVDTYFQVIDDHLYMPLQRFYEAAAGYDYDSPVLQLLREVLPSNSEIARNIARRMIELYPNYRCHSGNLSDLSVITSSIRDIEMFQIYLWVCVLEDNIAAIQQELFPLCVMLYPTLGVRWELVRQMLHLMRMELKKRLEPPQLSLFMPFFQALWDMFSPDVFPETLKDEDFGSSAS